MYKNIILDVDSYKTSHFNMYPPGTTSMFAYVASRGGKFDKTVFFGLQYILKEYLSKPVTLGHVIGAQNFFQKHGVPFNYEGWARIATKLDGRLPIRIRAVPEGTIVPTGNVMLTAESTDPETFWIVSWLETQLLRVWDPMNVATLGWHIKQIIMSYLEKSSNDPGAEIPFKLHDFGSRGVGCMEKAALCGAAHTVNFMGSDTVVGVQLANEYYDCEMAAFSIPASEHSTITSWGREHETEAFENVLNNYAKPGAIVACVSDSYDIFNATTNIWGGTLKKRVIESGATIVIRPDSGEPVTMVMEVIRRLDHSYGHVINSKGYKVLNHVRVIQGDGNTLETIRDILEAVTSNGYSATNVAFGMGGALLQQHDRDTQKMAMKTSSVTVNNVQRDVYKDPISDVNKRSLKGRLDLVNVDRKLQTVVIKDSWESSAPGTAMHTVFENGELKNETTLDAVRARANAG